MGTARRDHIGMIVLAMLPLLAGGCAVSEQAVTLKDPSEFQAVALGAQVPALVMFYKDGCETCEEMEPMIDSLATQYKGRAVVARLMVINLVRARPWPEINAKYDITLVPTVVLFVGGQEKQRWVAEFDKGRYKEALDKYVRSATPPAREAGGPPKGY